MKKIKITRDLAEALEGRRQAFLKKFGREPGNGDPIFFDPDAIEPCYQTEAQIEEMHETMCSIMTNAGIDPALIFAFRKTGRILTAENMQYLTLAELKEWNEAIAEFRSRGGTTGSEQRLSTL